MQPGNTIGVRWWLCGALALSGCGVMTDADFEGEILASLTGVINRAPDHETPPIEVCVAWVNPMAGCIEEPARDFKEPEAEFPARFRLDLTEPPSLTSRDLAVGRLEVFEAGYSTHPDPGAPLLGADERHALVWIERGERGAAMAQAYGLPGLAPGYHVLDVLGPGGPGERDRVALSPDDLDTELAIDLEATELEIDVPDLGCR